MSGPKHHLTTPTFDKLKTLFTELTDGGCSMSKDELKKSLSNNLIKDRESTTEKNTYMTVYLKLPFIDMLMKSSPYLTSTCSTAFRIKPNQDQWQSLALEAPSTFSW